VAPVKEQLSSLTISEMRTPGIADTDERLKLA
jgi:hypothetical protein